MQKADQNLRSKQSGNSRSDLKETNNSNMSNNTDTVDSISTSSSVKNTKTHLGLSLVSHLQTFLGEVSVVGLKYVVSSGISFGRRLLWTLSVLFGLAFMCYQITDRVAYYAGWPTKVTIEVVDQKMVRFPTVTICNENKVSKKRAERQHGASMVDLIRSMNRIPGEFVSLMPTPEQYATNATDWGVIYDELAQPREEAIFMCDWDGKPCNESHLTSIQTDMGLCHQFNGGDTNLSVTRPGNSQGLRLILFTNQEDYLLQNSGSISAGFRISAHDPADYLNMADESFRVAPGYQTNVAVYVQEVQNIGSPYVHCEGGSSYRESRCGLDCFTNFIVQNCSCRHPYMVTTATNFPICGPDKTDCLLAARTYYFKNNLKAECECAKQCDTITYQITPSQNVLSKFMMDLMAEKYDVLRRHDDVYAYVTSEYAVVEVYLPTLSHQETRTEAAYSILALLCDVGGAMGLILGSTILTVVEFMDFAAIRSIKAIQAYKQNK